jgi:hypothetical protein
LSRGSGPSGYPTKPLVSYQINRQLSGWNLPPLVIRAFGAHCQEQTFGIEQMTLIRLAEPRDVLLPSMISFHGRYSLSQNAT